MRIALIGLGAMGLPVARRLAGGAGIELTVFDLDGARLDRAEGLGRRAESAADAARDADAVFTLLPADRHVESVAGEIAGAPGRIFADFSTIGPGTIERVAGRLAQSGIDTVSVAVTRGTAAAEVGELALFVGGDEGVAAAIRPALETMATEIRHTGGLGSAKALKIANNMIVSCLDVAICEAIVLGRKLGVEAEAVTAHLAEHGADSWALRNHIVRFVLPDDLGPGHFSTVNMAKDVGLFVEMATANGTPSLLAGTASACYRGAIAHGFGEDYHPVVIRWLERGASGETRPAREDPLPAICRAVVAVQALANLDALRSLRPTGIEPVEAAEHLESGSAGNASLRATAAAMAVEPDSLVADLEQAIELANRASVPALMFESARHAALALR